MDLTTIYKNRYFNFNVDITTIPKSYGTEYAPDIPPINIVTACYYISEQQSFTSDVNIWEILPNEIQVEIEKQIN